MTDARGDPHLSLRPPPTAAPDLAHLAARARRDLELLAHPAAAWVRPLSLQADTLLPDLGSFYEPELDPCAAAMFSPIAARS